MLPPILIQPLLSERAKVRKSSLGCPGLLPTRRTAACDCACQVKSESTCPPARSISLSFCPRPLKLRTVHSERAQLLPPPLLQKESFVRPALPSFLPSFPPPTLEILSSHSPLSSHLLSVLLHHRLHLHPASSIRSLDHPSLPQPQHRSNTVHAIQAYLVELNTRNLARNVDPPHPLCLGRQLGHVQRCQRRARWCWCRRCCRLVSG